jgi:hypothetical protein
MAENNEADSKDVLFTCLLPVTAAHMLSYDGTCTSICHMLWNMYIPLPGMPLFWPKKRWLSWLMECSSFMTQRSLLCLTFAFGHGSWNSVAHIVTGPSAGWPGVCFLAATRFFSSRKLSDWLCVRPSLLYMQRLPRVKQQGCEVTGAEVKNEWSYALSFSICRNIMHWENCIVHVLSFHCLYLVFNSSSYFSFSFSPFWYCNPIWVLIFCTRSFQPFLSLNTVFPSP